ncbi:Uncharacterised protein [Serratia fonticola]|uniref:HNH endonuclease n=1 Tax=Serratia fonticola TaxID=47917 RepID=UPI00217AF781|nr:HNH endonuclease [Serratia fonticola]CAI1192201.1 Uncharacterised protein [Serratia fonticola]
MNYKKVSNDLIRLRNELNKNIAADNEDWADLVHDLIPENLRNDWADWIRKNIKHCLDEGIETQSELLLLSFLSTIKEDDFPSQSQVPLDEQERKYTFSEVRNGQTEFSIGVRKNCHGRCVVTGCAILSRLQSAHIIPHKDNVDYSVDNGLLLRADIHQMFDKGDCAIDPITRMIFFKENVLAIDSDIKEFHGKTIHGFVSDINWPSLSERWKAFAEKRYE